MEPNFFAAPFLFDLIEVESSLEAVWRQEPEFLPDFLEMELDF